VFYYSLQRIGSAPTDATTQPPAVEVSLSVFAARRSSARSYCSAVTAGLASPRVGGAEERPEPRGGRLLSAGCAGVAPLLLRDVIAHARAWRGAARGGRFTAIALKQAPGPLAVAACACCGWPEHTPYTQ
jgi:hypothetical protein